MPVPSVIRAAPPGGRRCAGWGFSVVAGWAAISVLVLIVMSETRTGPFARLATGFLGLRDFAGLATFLLGLHAFGGEVASESDQAQEAALRRWSETARAAVLAALAAAPFVVLFQEPPAFGRSGAGIVMTVSTWPWLA